jgi:hypothetical protein
VLLVKFRKVSDPLDYGFSRSKSLGKGLNDEESNVSPRTITDL